MFQDVTQTVIKDIIHSIHSNQELMKCGRIYKSVLNGTLIKKEHCRGAFDKSVRQCPDGEV